MPQFLPKPHDMGLMVGHAILRITARSITPILPHSATRFTDLPAGFSPNWLARISNVAGLMKKQSGSLT
jgi:hypothetical protein